MGSEIQPSPGRPVRDVVREVVTKLAPDELPLLEGLLELDDTTVFRRPEGHGQRREPLGFGVGEVAVLVTPVVWVALDQAARRYSEHIADGIWVRSGRALRRLSRRSGPPPEVPPLSHEQLADVKRVVLEVSKQRGLSSQQAEDVANAVVTRLFLSDPPEAPAPDQNRPDSTGTTPED